MKNKKNTKKTLMSLISFEVRQHFKLYVAFDKMLNQFVTVNEKGNLSKLVMCAF